MVSGINIPSILETICLWIYCVACCPAEVLTPLTYVHAGKARPTKSSANARLWYATILLNGYLVFVVLRAEKFYVNNGCYPVLLPTRL